jgi:hypothetical protein
MLKDTNTTMYSSPYNILGHIMDGIKLITKEKVYMAPYCIHHTELKLTKS